MLVSPVTYSTNFKSVKKENITEQNNRKKTCNPVSLTGKISLGCLCAAAVTGYLHMKKAHMVSSLLTAGAVTAHVLSLKPHTPPSHDFNA